MPPTNTPSTAEYAKTSAPEGCFLKMLTRASTKPMIPAPSHRNGIDGASTQLSAAPTSSNANAPTVLAIVSSTVMTSPEAGVDSRLYMSLSCWFETWFATATPPRELKAASREKAGFLSAMIPLFGVGSQVNDATQNYRKLLGNAGHCERAAAL